MAEAAKQASGGSQIRLYLQKGGVEELLVPNAAGKIERKPVKECDFLDGYTGLYFSAHWCGPCRQFTPLLAKKYPDMKNEKGDVKFTIIFNSWDSDQSSFDNYFGEMPWCAIPYEYKDSLKEVSSDVLKQPNGIPQLYLFSKGELYQKAGRMAVTDGRAFPYEDASLETVLDAIIDEKYEKVQKSDLKKLDYLFFYFSAHWCPPCRAFTPQLAAVYKKLVEKMGKDKNFEIIFTSSDKDVEQWKSYFKEMPWLALNKEHKDYDFYKSSLSEMFGVEGIPQLSVMKMGDQPQIIVKNARGGVSSDPEGEKFPWIPKAYNDVEESLDGIQEHPSIVLLINKQTNEDQQKKLAGFLEPHAKKMNEVGCMKRVCFHFTVTGEDQGPAQKIRELSKSGDDDKMLLLNLPKNEIVKVGLPLSADDVSKFYDDYKAGKLKEQTITLG